MLLQFVIGLLMCVCLDLVQSQADDRGILGKHALNIMVLTVNFTIIFSIHGECSDSTLTAQC